MYICKFYVKGDFIVLFYLLKMEFKLWGGMLYV